jgi:hypothetical protein
VKDILFFIMGKKIKFLLFLNKKELGKNVCDLSLLFGSTSAVFYEHPFLDINFSCSYRNQVKCQRANLF